MLRRPPLIQIKLLTSVSLSKKLENHIGTLTYFFCQYNLEKQKERFGCDVNL